MICTYNSKLSLNLSLMFWNSRIFVLFRTNFPSHNCHLLQLTMYNVYRCECVCFYISKGKFMRDWKLRNTLECSTMSLHASRKIKDNFMINFEKGNFPKRWRHKWNLSLNFTRKHEGYSVFDKEGNISGNFCCFINESIATCKKAIMYSHINFPVSLS